MRETVPGWEAKRIGRTGHFVMMEKPAEFNALLSDFLARIGP